jgi:hypothetical protein
MLVLYGERISFDSVPATVVIPEVQVIHTSQDSDFSIHPRGIPQSLRDKNPSLFIHRGCLTEVIRSVQKLFFGRVEGRSRGETLFNFLPNRKGINPNGFAVETGNVEVAAPGILDNRAETGRDLDPAFLVDSGWLVSTEHSET